MPTRSRTARWPWCHARGVFPDGLTFNMPECDAPPPARNISDVFPPTRDALEILLAIPPRRERGLNCATSELDAPAARYLAETRVFHDENSGQDERPVQLGPQEYAPGGGYRIGRRPGHAAHRPRDPRRRRPLHLRPRLRPSIHTDQRQRTAHADAAQADRNPGG